MTAPPLDGAVLRRTCHAAQFSYHDRAATLLVLDQLVPTRRLTLMPLTRSEKALSHPACSRASTCESSFWVDELTRHIQPCRREVTRARRNSHFAVTVLSGKVQEVVHSVNKRLLAAGLEHLCWVEVVPAECRILETFDSMDGFFMSGDLRFWERPSGFIFGDDDYFIGGIEDWAAELVQENQGFYRDYEDVADGYLNWVPRPHQRRVYRAARCGSWRARRWAWASSATGRRSSWTTDWRTPCFVLPGFTAACGA